MEMFARSEIPPPPPSLPPESGTSSDHNASRVADGYPVTYTIPNDGVPPCPPTCTGAAETAVAPCQNRVSTDRPPPETEEKPVGENLPEKEELGNATLSNIIVNDACDGMEEIDEDGSEAESNYFFEHVCAICDNGGDLLCCEGKCLRSFHPTKESGIESNCDSLGYSNEQVKKMEDENQTFLCKNCQVNQHQCFVCGKLGSSDKSASAEVFQCVAGTCGYFYHPKCALKALRFKFRDNAKDLEHEIAAGKPFMCSIHYCARCHELEPEDRSHKEMQFAVCRRCPRAYHKKCLPRMISFGDAADISIVQRAWTGLMPNRILMYCLAHEIDDELGTPSRNHVRFPDSDQETYKQRSAVLSNKYAVPKKIVKYALYQSNDIEKSSSLSLKKKDFAIADEGQSSVWEMPKKRKLADISRSAVKKTFHRKDNYESIDAESMTSLGEQLFGFYKGSNAVKTAKGETSDTKEPKRKSKSVVKDFNDLMVLDDDSKMRIHSIRQVVESSIMLEDLMKKHKTPKTRVCLSKPILQIMQHMTLGKVEGSIAAIRAAKQKLDDGGSLEDAKAVCEPGLLDQITKFRRKLKVYLAPFLHGPRYTSFGRHFTKTDKLQAIVDKLHCYVKDGDTLVDFCCGANEFSWLMKQKMDKAGKHCNFKNYDLFIPKNAFNFEQKDWMTVQTSDLPPGSQLIMGLNPPFGFNASLANKFIEKALQFKPKLLILIVPRETGRLDEKNSYDLIWEDDRLLEGKAFYLPGSVDVNDKQLDDWNMSTPPLYLWSRQDWTTKHRDIAEQQGHLPVTQKIELCLLQKDSAHHSEMRAQIQMYGHPNSSFASYLGNQLPAPGPGLYEQQGATLNPAYDSVNTSAMNWYNFRLDDSNRMMTNSGGRMQQVGGQRGTHHMGSHPGRGGHQLDFARRGPFPPFSQQGSSGWLNK